MACFCTLGSCRKSNSWGSPSRILVCWPRWGSGMGYVPDFSDCKAWPPYTFPQVCDCLEVACGTWETPNIHRLGGSWMGFEAHNGERNQLMWASGMIYTPMLFRYSHRPWHQRLGFNYSTMVYIRPSVCAPAIAQQDHDHGHWGHMAAVMPTHPAHRIWGLVSFIPLPEHRASWSSTHIASTIKVIKKRFKKFEPQNQLCAGSMLCVTWM